MKFIIHKYLKNIAVFFILILFLNSCGGLKPDWGEPAEPDGRKRARQNVEEGRGFGTGLFKKNGGGTNFEFASSNPLWRASLDTLDFMVLATVDYAGGLIISDWYSQGNPDEAIKITIRFLDNQVRVDSLKITIHKKKCKNSNCVVNKIDTDLTSNIRDKILKKAALYVKTADDKKRKKKKKKIIQKDSSKF
tara:strand:+ start:472 stop:1047 length:576 start_codon:yes stop_codon:yes gene_type:complete